MVRLIFYESKKLMGKRLIPALLLFLFAFNGLMLYRESGQRIDWSYTRKDVGRVYEDLAGLTAPEAEERLTEKKELLSAVSVWREWTDGYGEWNGEERRAFQERNREILEKYPDLDPEGSSLLPDQLLQRAEPDRHGPLPGVGGGPLRRLPGGDRRGG